MQTRLFLLLISFLYLSSNQLFAENRYHKVQKCYLESKNHEERKLISEIYFYKGNHDVRIYRTSEYFPKKFLLTHQEETTDGKLIDTYTLYRSYSNNPPPYFYLIYSKSDLKNNSRELEVTLRRHDSSEMMLTCAVELLD